MQQLAEARPDRVSHVANLDGLASKRLMPDVLDRARTRMLLSELEGWLNHRRAAGGAERRPGTIDDLAARRHRLNPRLPIEWLRYLVTIGGRRDPDGWRWKLDPSMRFGGFGPCRPEWSLCRTANLGLPFLGVLGLQVEEMGWGTRAEDVEPWLPPGARFVVLPDAGHFVHIEEPIRIAELVLELVGTR